MSLPQDVGDYVLWIMWSIGCLMLGASFKLFSDGIIKYYQAKITVLRAVIYDLNEKKAIDNTRLIDPEYRGAEHQEKR